MVAEAIEPWDNAQAAAVIGISPGTLRNWRVAGRGPQFRRAGRKVVYDPPVIDQWKAANTVSSTSEAA